MGRRVEEEWDGELEQRGKDGGNMLKEERKGGETGRKEGGGGEGR